MQSDPHYAIHTHDISLSNFEYVYILEHDM